MTTLHDRLADLADDAPPGGPAPDLWERGRRYQRQRRAGTLVIAAAVVLGLVALGTLDWWRARPEPMPANGSPALPQKIWAPSRWLPGTDDAGPLGPLAAVEDATRGSWTGDHAGVVGISAETGEYRYLDLPDVVYPGFGRVALAPDGRHVAYWYRGETAKSPNSASGPTVGVAVYDSTTGDVVRHAVPTDHGLSAEDLVWADSDRLVLRYLQYQGGDADDEMSQGSAGDDSGLLLWSLDTGTIAPLGLSEDVESSTVHGQLLLSGERMTWLDVDHPDRRTTFPTPERSLMYIAAVDDHGDRIAWVVGNRNPNTVAVGRVGAGHLVTSPGPDSGQPFRVRAWRDADHILVDRRVGPGYGRTALFDVDVRTGASTEVLRYPVDSYGSGAVLARDLLDLPSVDRPAPPTPLDPRKVAGGTVAVVLAGVGALVLWRRRVRP